MSNLYHCSDYLKLFKLARDRFISPEHYYRFEKFQGELLVRYLKHFSIELQDNWFGFEYNDNGWT